MGQNRFGGKGITEAYDAVRNVCMYRRRAGTGDERERNVRTYNNIMTLLRTAPPSILKASLDGKFWKEIEKVIDLETTG